MTRPPGARFLRPSDHWIWGDWPFLILFLAAWGIAIWAIVYAAVTT